MKTTWNKIKSNKAFHYAKIISESAGFALFLSIVFFAYEMVQNVQESKEMTDNLKGIQSSLSTRYLGEFPNFLPDINELYNGAKKGDSIIIFEDVLFYGVSSAPKEFYNANQKLLALADSCCPIMIAYYKPDKLAYNLTIQEWLLSPECYNKYRIAWDNFRKQNRIYKQKRKGINDSFEKGLLTKDDKCALLCNLLDSCFAGIVDDYTLSMQKERICLPSHKQVNDSDESQQSKKDDNEIIRNILLEKYFAETRAADPQAFKELVNKYRCSTMAGITSIPSTRSEKENARMCQQMDSIRIKYLGKESSSVESIKFADFQNMFIEMNNIMENTFKKYAPQLNLVPIEDFLSVRSWLIIANSNKSKAVMAFPSRYSSSEIGFYTTDKSTADYIKTMRNGILINREGEFTE